MTLFMAWVPSSILLAQISLTTYHNDQARDGWNQNETILTTANVNTTEFGKLFSDAVDGQVYAQPLYLPNVSIGGGTHNVIYIVTENDSAYAFDADNAGVTYWHDSFIGGVTMTVSQADVGGCPQITPQIGITDTPVIDPATGTIYFVAMTKTVSRGVTTFTQTLYALDVTSGAEKFNGPQTIAATAPGTGDGGTTVKFRPLVYKERCALALVNGVVYTSWTGHCDFDTLDGNYYGWVLGYNASNITAQVSVFCASPNGSESSFWESGDGPSVDSSGNLYYIAGNGTFDTSAPVSDFGQCILKLNTIANAVTALDYFAPLSQAAMSSGDQDMGSAGQCLLPASWGTTAHPSLLLGADKPGDLYVVDADTGSMGKYSTTANNIVQTVLPIGGKGYTTPAIYSNGVTQFVYWGMTGAKMKAYVFSNGQYVTPNSSATSETYSGSSSGCVPSVSSNGTTNGIVWGLLPGTPVQLCAYDATNLTKELYTSAQNSARDSAVATYVKFAPPSVVNGKVYVPTASSLVVYGLISTGGTATFTSTVTRTPSPTPTLSPTVTSTPTQTRTTTLTSTATSTSTNTSTKTSTATPTTTATFSMTTTATFSSTSSPTAVPPTVTFTATSSRTSTAVFTATPTLTSTPTVTSTGTPTNSFTFSPTPIPTGTNTATPTTSKTSTSTPVPPTFTTTPVHSSTPTAIPSSTPTATFSATLLNTFTATASSTNTLVNSFTPTSVNSSTPTWTPSSTSTSVPTSAYTPSATPSTTPSLTPSPTFTPTASPSLEPSPSGTPTVIVPAKPVLYPNPVKGGTSAELQVTLLSAANVRVQIFTLSFRKVFDQTYSNLSAGVDDLPVSLVHSEGHPLANGLYYVVVTVNGQRTLLKLLILK